MRNTHPEDIKARIRKRGMTLSGLARRAKDLSDSAVRKALRQPVPRGNDAIADFLGATRHQLWPEWYGPDGGRLAMRSKRSNSALGAHRQKAGAA
ncbi:MAG: helix-turn-helix domain-containing protein [Alphaproteobacteria bacterium]|nr:helix-turn-helix domain-containing protein [Alphaproteobacteria bacterium]